MSTTKLLLLLFCPVLSFAQNPLVRAKQDYNAGNYVPALRGAVSVYGSALKDRNDTLAADAGNLVGLVYLAQGQALNAMRYFREASVTNSRAGKERRVAADEINIALAFSDLKQLDSAVFYAQQALARSRRSGAANLVTMAANHLGDFYTRSGQPQQAEVYFKEVLESDQSAWENSFARSGLARIRMKGKQYGAAAVLAEQAYTDALQAGAKWDAVQALDIAQRAHHALHQDALAYERLSLLKTYSDSLSSADKDRELNRLQLHEKSLQNAALRDRARIDQLLIIIVSLVALLLATLAGLVYYRQRRAQRRNRDLSQLNTEKDRLFSIIGHDLKSPFATLQSTLQLLSTGDLDQAEMAAISRQLAEQVQSASVMLDSLLTWAGKQLQSLRAEPQPLDLPVKVNKVIAVLKAGAERKQVRLRHEAVILPRVSGDADQVRILIQNLLANAIKFTPAGGLVEVSYRSEPAFVELSVRDSGVGMPAELLRTILSPQSHARSTYGTENEKGIGLGMLLVRDFAAQNHIALSAESTPGQGTVFHLVFQLA